MLAPDSRSLLLDSLRPPVGMKLDRAVATTYTLDLTTALTVPLALAGFNLSGSPDVIAVMEALRSTVDRIDIFAQAGMISADGWPGDLTALLEGSIHTVRRPRPGHLFHPKLWVLRFVSSDDETSYRCLITSRNLSADRSWDVILRLDSDPEITKVNAANEGLVRLIEALPDMADSGMDGERREAITMVAAAPRRVWWHMPDHVGNVTFHALGVPGGIRPSALRALFRGQRHLLISPFVTAEGIAILQGDSAATDLTVVSRAEELDRLEPEALAGSTVFTLNPLAGLGDREAETTVETRNMLGDLHAKVFVIESNKRSRVYVGSANATHGAFNGNVEIMCELAGGVKAVGTQAMLADDAPFRSLLEMYSSPVDPVVDLEREAGRKLEAYLIDVAEVGFTVGVHAADTSWAAVVRSQEPIPSLPAGIEGRVFVAPYNRRAELAEVDVGDLVEVALSPRAAADITAFLLLSVEAVVDGRKVERSTVVCARLVGAPSERLDDILVRQLDTPEKFLRFLMLLLALGADAPTGLDASLTGKGSWNGGTAEGLFELMVRALAAHPEAIDRLAGIVEHLQGSALGDQVLPAGWDGVWSAVRGARSLVGREVRS